MKFLIIISLLLIAPFAKGQQYSREVEKMVLDSFNVPESVKDSALSGKISFEFRISTYGKIDSVLIIKNQLNTDCEVEVLRVMRFIADNYLFIEVSNIPIISWVSLVFKDGELVTDE